jgi:hypothetical protein
MTGNNSGHDGGIETETEAVEAIKTGDGVVADGVRAHTTGEGRQTRYLLGGDNVPKAEVVEAVLEADEVEAADQPDHGTIVCRVCGDELGYLTGSHMQTHADNQPQTVGQYREAVAARNDADPEDVPLAPDALAEVFESAGDHDEETLDELSELNEARWEAGEYDHLRGGEGAEA